MKFLQLLCLFCFSTLFAQNPGVDFKTVHASITANPVKRNVVGQGKYTFEVTQKPDTIRIDAQKMEFTNVKLNGLTVKFGNNKKQLLLFENIKKGENTLTFEYEAFPTQTMYFVNWDFTKDNLKPEDIQGQIWTQGQGKETSHWLPSFNDVNDKAVFSLDITFEKSFEVISNGTLKNKIKKGEEITWQYAMDQPMSSYLVMLAIGHFKKQEDRSLTGIPLEMYYEREDSAKLEPTYRYSTKTFDFLEAEIGVAYPWKIYRQVPVRDFLYAGMENTSATTFSRDFIVDAIAYNDRNYLNVNAHELAHQWFGDLVTAKSSKDHWLQEGFATYYALLAERKIFGDDYFYYKLYQTSRQIQQAAETDKVPLRDPKASSLSFYQKGAWALHILHEALGREKFDLMIKNYLNKYAYQNVTTEDLLEQVKLVSSNFDTKAFEQKWLDSAEFPEDDVNAALQKNDFIQRYIALVKKPLDLKEDKAEILKILQSDEWYPIKELMVYQHIAEPFDDKAYLLSAALATGNTNVRQAVAVSLVDIPEKFRLPYEGLLGDPSYETQEMALLNLWKSFPSERKRYVELSKNWVGFQDKNLKLQHLSLAFLTLDDKEKLKAYRELLVYTGTNFDSNVQQAALQKLLDLQVYTEDVFRSLVYGTANHRWQFVKFSKDNIRKLLKDSKNREVFVKIRTGLPIREKTQLQRLLEE
jgi:aminopeptidase N